MKIKLLCCGMTLAWMLSVPAVAMTLSLLPDGQWYLFDVDKLASITGGLDWIDLSDEVLIFQVDLTQPALLEVVDGGFGGDRFEVFDKSILLGTTSIASQTFPTSKALDFEAAYADPQWSQASFLLSPGNHQITGLLSTSALDEAGNPLNATVGAVRLMTVPEPTGWMLFIMGGGLLATWRHRSN